MNILLRTWGKSVIIQHHHSHCACNHTILNIFVNIRALIQYQPINLMMMSDSTNPNVDHLGYPEDLCHQKSCAHTLFVFRQQIDVVTEALVNVESKLKELAKNSGSMSKDDLILKINGISNFKESLTKKLDISNCDINIFSQRQSELNTAANSILSIDTINKVYEVPVEIQVQRTSFNQLYEIPIELQPMVTLTDLQKYFNQVSNWNGLPQPLQRSISRIITPSTLNRPGSSKPENMENPQLQISFENYKNNENNIQHSFSISEVSRTCHSVEIQTQEKITNECGVQTAEHYRLDDQEDCDGQEDFMAIDATLKNIENILLHEIPVEIQIQKEGIEFGIQTDDPEQCSCRQNEMNTILQEVDGVLGSIQQMLYELPNQQYSFSTQYEIKSIDISEEKKEIDGNNMEGEENQDYSGQIMDEAEGTLNNMGKILYGVAQYKPQFEFRSIQLVDQIVQTMKDQESRSGIYEIPIQMELIEESQEEGEISQDDVCEDQNKNAWGQVNSAMCNIQKLLASIPQIKDNNFKNLPSSNLDEISQQHVEEAKPTEQKQYDEYLQKMDKFRLDKQSCENLEWKEVDGALEKIQKIFYELPTEIIPEKSMCDKQIQTYHIQEESDHVSSYFDQCQTKKSQIQKDWLEIDGALANIQQALYEIPIMINEEYSASFLDNQPITHESYMINNYEIPVEMQIESNCDSSEEQRHCQNIIQETVGNIAIASQKVDAKVLISEYEIPNDLEIEEDWAVGKNLTIQNNVYQQSIISFVNQTQLVNKSVQAEIRTQYTEIGVGVHIQTNEVPTETQIHNQIEQICAQTQTDSQQLAMIIEQEPDNDTTEVQYTEKQQESHSQQNSLDLQKLNFENLHKTVTKPIKSVNTSRNDIPHQNKSYYVEFQSSEGNLTDRSILLRRNNRNNCFESLSPSTNLKQEQIVPEQYYELLEINEKLEEKIGLFEEIKIKVQNLETQKSTQKKFFMTQKVFNEKKIKSLEHELQSFKNIASEIHEKYEDEINKSEGLQDTIRELQEKIKGLEEVISEKMITFSDTNDKYEEHLEYLYSTIRKLRLDLDECEQEKRCLTDEKYKELFNYNEQMTRKQNIMYYIQKQNQKLKHEIQVERQINEQLKNSMSDLFGRVQTAIFEHGASEDLEQIYSGHLKKMKQELTKKEEDLSKLQNQNEVLRDNVDQFIQQIQNKNTQIQKLQQKILDMETQKKNSKKIIIQPLLENELEFLRKGYVNANHQLLKKQQQILQLNEALETMKDRSVKSLSVNFMPVDNRQCGNLTQRSSYVQQLEEIIQEYEHIITHNQKTIKELQDEVYEYLGEALEKEEQLEILCQEIFSEEEYDNEEDLNEVANKLDSALKNYNTKTMMAIEQAIHPEQTIKCLQIQEEGISVNDDYLEEEIFFKKFSSKKEEHRNYSSIQKVQIPRKNQTVQHEKKMIN